MPGTRRSESALARHHPALRDARSTGHPAPPTPGRLDLLEDRPERALPAFRASADLRRDAEDYLGMARVLAFAGEAAERAGLSDDAADLYFRAGRSAEVERDVANARRWLGAAARLAATTGQTAILAQANDRLESLAEPAER